MCTFNLTGLPPQLLEATADATLAWRCCCGSPCGSSTIGAHTRRQGSFLLGQHIRPEYGRRILARADDRMTNSPAKISAVPVMLSLRRGEMEYLFVKLNTFNYLLDM
jgi:hypothetical protein